MFNIFDIQATPETSKIRLRNLGNLTDFFLDIFLKSNVLKALRIFCIENKIP